MISSLNLFLDQSKLNMKLWVTHFHSIKIWRFLMRTLKILFFELTFESVKKEKLKMKTNAWFVLLENTHFKRQPKIVMNAWKMQTVLVEKMLRLTLAIGDSIIILHCFLNVWRRKPAWEGWTTTNLWTTPGPCFVKTGTQVIFVLFVKNLMEKYMNDPGISGAQNALNFGWT